MNYFSDRKVWIIGASEGIGKALLKKIQPLSNFLFISSRNKKKLDAIKGDIKNISVHDMDVCNYDEFKITAKKIFDLGCDTVIFSVGYYKPTSFTNYNLSEQLQTIDINLKSFLYFIEFLNLYKNNINKIVVLASSASYIGLPGNFAYGSSKAALLNLCECLQAELPNVHIQVVNCGFVQTRLTMQNKFIMPMIMSAEKAAEKIVKNIPNNNFEITFPKKFILILKILRLIPYKLYFKIISYLKLYDK